MEPLGIPNHKKTRKMNTQKNTKKLMQKVSKKVLKKDYFFVAERSQNQKNPSLELKMCPKPPGRVPRHPKYSKIIKKTAPGPPKSFKIMKIW